MPPKKPAQAKTGATSKSDNVDDAPLQAVILADSYNRRFEVLCLDQPRILLPLCSTPLLAWTLESLSLSKVKQVFVFCGVHADKIKEWVSTCSFQSTMDIQCLTSKAARTAGDALRELDAMGVLNAEQPFILVHSPLVSNYEFSKMVEAHKQRKEKDKHFIMTVGVGRGGRRHPESPIMLVHPPTNRLLHYVPHAISPAQRRATFPASLFMEEMPPYVDTYEVWSGTSSRRKGGASNKGGYRDLGVDICDADIPALCTENFDWHDLRRHVVNGVLTSELLGKRIAVSLIGDEADGAEGGKYAERIRDTRTFAEITRDVLRRWVFPLAPDLNEPGGVQYELREGNLYIARDNVVLSRTTTLRGPLLIGPRSALNNHTTVSQSTLGADCSVGPNTLITSSFIFDDVRIGAQCTISTCIIGKGVQIADGVVIGRGALVGDGVKIGKGVTVPEFARIGRQRYRPEGWDEDDEDEEQDKREDARNLDILGPDSDGYLWPQEEEEVMSDSDDEGEDPYEHPTNKSLLQLGRSLSRTSGDASSVSTLSVASSSEAGSPLSMASSDDMPDMPSLNLDAGPPPAFFSEAAASLARAYEEEHSVENALLELRTLVMGYNAGVDRAREEVVEFLTSKIALEGGAAKVLADGIRVWSRWGKLAIALTNDLSNIALDIQNYCAKNAAARPFFGIILRSTYEADILPEEDLIEWRSLSAARGEGAKEGEERDAYKELYLKGKAYVDVLEQMESDSEEEDDSEEDDDDEDEDED